MGPMGTDLAALLISSVFVGVGFVIAKFFPEASLMAAVFLVGLAILNIAGDRRLRRLEKRSMKPRPNQPITPRTCWKT